MTTSRASSPSRAASAAPADRPLISLRAVTRRYQPGGRLALDGLSLDVRRGELVAVLGTSGSGKSTLLHVLGGLDLAYEGVVELDGRELHALRDAELAALRHRTVGYVFQSFHLVPTWSVRQNVCLPASFSSKVVPDLAAKADALLQRVGLEGRGTTSPRPSRAGSGSAWPSPARSCSIPLCCCAMSRRGVSTSRPGGRCSSSSSRCTARRGSRW
ncbi:MAG: ATP-binding cassette domain-containing protein [Polyangiales bacterium]